jgi:uncharacterized protein (DUF433 family)
VELILKKLAQGETETQIIAEQPRLTRKEIHAALDYSATPCV